MRFIFYQSTFLKGIPKSFTTVAELIKFVTMVIFTCSGQHSAVNAGQYDYGGWMPNCPISLQLPPPTTKGETSEATMLQTFLTSTQQFREWPPCGYSARSRLT
ncbi:hypothetical protein FQN60_002443, partial [Etheostoma spectabile]